MQQRLDTLKDLPPVLNIFEDQEFGLTCKISARHRDKVQAEKLARTCCAINQLKKYECEKNPNLFTM